MKKKVKTLIISASVVTGLAMTAGLVALTVNSSIGKNGGNVSFCAKPIGRIPYQIEKTIRINKHISKRVSATPECGKPISHMDSAAIDRECASRQFVNFQ